MDDILPLLRMEMSSLLQEHCQLIKERNIFSIIDKNACSFLPPDVWIKHTMNKGWWKIFCSQDI